MKKLTKSEKYIANHKIESLIKCALALNPNCEIERVNEITVKINGHSIECKNFSAN